MSRDGRESSAEGDVWVATVCIDGPFFSEHSAMMFHSPKEATRPGNQVPNPRTVRT